MTNHNHPRDLDMSDVEADANYHRQMLVEGMLVEFDRKDTPELEEMRYKIGESARQGNEYSILALRTLDHLLTGRIITHLCEGCWGRWGCDMCCPPTFDDTDYSGWYGGERGYQDGLRWSDFI